MASRLRDRVLRLRSRLHGTIFSVSNGRLLRRWGGLPVVLLTTTGRRTGLARRTILVSPVQDGDRFVLVASNGGSPRHPNWYLNIQHDPRADIVTAAGRSRVVARTATAAEKERLWPRITARSPSYSRYQARTDRSIPVVVLESPTP